MNLQLGNKILPVDRYELIDGKLIPVIQATSTEVHYPDGRIDCTVHVPVLSISAKTN